MSNKIYMLRWESRYSDGSEASGLNPVCFKELERARDELNTIKLEEMCFYEDNGMDMEDIKVMISISHIKSIAQASAICYSED